MRGSNKNIRLIISCNTKGVAQELILDSDNFFELTEFPVGLHNLVAPDSLEALADFWLQVMDISMVENFLIKLRSGYRVTNVTFSGYLLNDKILLCGSNIISSTEKVLNDILQITNEQQNHIRLAEKKMIHLQRTGERRELNEGALNDFSLLNNELINKQRELAQKNAKILHLNKKLEVANENMTMFAYAVSHDLKEPVRMVSSFMSLFNKKFGSTLDKKAKKYVYYALDGAQRLDNMIDDLLTYYRASGITSNEIVDLNKVVNDVLGLLQNPIEERNAQFIISTLPVLHGSHTGWRQIFQNLISNAIKFMPDDRLPEIKISAIQTENSWHISVSDNGIGIEPEYQQTIFNHFKRVHTNEKYEGSGMGLAIVKKIVENFEGDIHLESESGKGTTFTISIVPSKPTASK